MAPHVRVLIRYVLMYLTARGYISDAVASVIGADEELANLISTIIFAIGAAAIEWATALARRWGWKT